MSPCCALALPYCGLRRMCTAIIAGARGGAESSAGPGRLHSGRRRSRGWSGCAGMGRHGRRCAGWRSKR
uniref:Uncharacterized protein n=1 Tax=Arundo donax TaxID=35708 RepID=A0A0A8ZEU9_ARUDO